MQFYFVTENESAGSNSLTGVIATALCALNKRNLQMEAAAAGRRIGFMIMLAQNMSPLTSWMELGFLRPLQQYIKFSKEKCSPLDKRRY